MDYCYCFLLLLFLSSNGTFTTTRTAIVSAQSTSTAVDTTLSTFESCSTTADCNEGNSIGTYCADIVEKCLPIGFCSKVFDCNNLDNQPYALAMCMGTLEYQQGRCVMNCGSIGDDGGGIIFCG